MPPAMNDLAAWIPVLLILAAAYPTAVWLLTRGDDVPDFWLPLLLSLALSTGGLTLVMLWELLAGIRIDLWSVTLPYLALMLPGGWFWWRAGRIRPPVPLPRTWPERFALGLLLLICGGVLFNSLYWPFSREDTLGIYARFAGFMYENRVLPTLPGPQTTYEAYPMLIPLAYTYAYLAAGWQNEFLARLFPALLSVGCIAAAFTLGKLLHSARAGWISALLLAVTPAYVSWASSGYVDLPMAFFYTLAAIFAWRVWQTSSGWDALLAGALAGLAAWTKNAALIGVGLIFMWLLWAWIWRRMGWRQVVTAMLACFGVAALWYIRNWLDAGMIIPPTLWVEQANQTIDTLFVLITRPETYSLIGPLLLLSLLTAVIEVLRRRFNAPELLLLLLLTVPFYAAWWLFASYDPRFILLFLPLLCVLAGVQLAKVWGQIPANWQRRLMIPLALVLLALALRAVWDSVEYKDNLLQKPLMDYHERRATVLRERQPHLYERYYGENSPIEP